MSCADFLLTIIIHYFLDKRCLSFVNACKHGALYDHTSGDNMTVMSTGESPNSTHMGVRKVCVIHSQSDEILIRLIISLLLF